jgi:SAM-dependent methyltransferase
MSPVSYTWAQGDSYEQYIGRWSRRVAPRFLSWLSLPAGLRWLDIGCGTGALSAAILDRDSPSSVTGVEPSEGFLAKAREQLGDRVLLRLGSAERIPLEDGSIEVTVSGLALNFVPDPRAALFEMQRVTVPGGMIAAYVWDYTGKMEMLRIFWDAAGDLDPEAAKLDEGPRFPLCRPEALSDLFTQAGLRNVEVVAIDIPARFESFDDYWRPFLGGQGPAPSYVMALDEAARTSLRNRIRDRLPIQSDGSISLTARAWAVRGESPGSIRMWNPCESRRTTPVGSCGAVIGNSVATSVYSLQDGLSRNRASVRTRDE